MTLDCEGKGRLQRAGPAAFEVTELLGEARVRSIYGNFSSSRLSFGNVAVHMFTLVPCRRSAHVWGKNAADIAIDSVDQTYSDGLDRYLLMSSDSNFTRLAQRLREGWIAVYGFGESKTPHAFRAACHRFAVLGKLWNGAAVACD